MAGQGAAILLFTAITLGLGYSVLWLARATRDKNPLIALIETLAVGVAAFSFLGPVLDTLHIPLHLTIYLALSLACPLTAFIYAIKDKTLHTQLKSIGKGWTTRATVCAILAILAGSLVFWMFHTGANAYPYLEDDDPWQHSQSTLYVALAHTAHIDPAVRELNPGYAFYLEPYPPSYDMVMGVLRQANDSTVWTLRFFNALLCGLAILFFFLAARAYLESDQKAAFATIALAALPSFMSHFIWSQTIALAVFPVALYASLRALDDKTWIAPAIVAVASEMVTQPVVSFVFGVMLILIVLLLFTHEALQPRSKSKTAGWKRLVAKFPKTLVGLAVGVGGLAASLALYWIPQIIKWTFAGFMKLRGGELTSGWGGNYALQGYDLWEQVIKAPFNGRIDQATGWGTILSLALVLGTLVILASATRTLNPRKGWRHIHLLVWTLLLAYAVLAPTFGFPGWGSSRAWAYLAIPLVLLAAEGSFLLARSISANAAIRLAIVTVLIIGIVTTSAPAKWSQQTSGGWPPGAQWLPVQTPAGGVDFPELRGYLKTQQLLPKGSRLYPLCGGDQRATGFDMISTPWDPDVALFRSQGIAHTGAETIAFLQRHSYQYVTIDASCVRDHGENATVAFVQDLASTGHVRQVTQDNGFLLAQLV